MRCRICRQPGSPISKLLGLLDAHDEISVLSACSGYHYDKHQNIPEKPFILLHVKSINVLDDLWRKLFSRLNAPTLLSYNGFHQFMFEIDAPKNWPNRDEFLISVWAQIDTRVREFVNE